MINEYAVLSSANAKALGLDVGELASDGEIWFNQVLLDDDDFDVDPNIGVQGFDFTGVATYEIGHILGFKCGVDTPDLVFHVQPIPPDQAEGLPTPEEINHYVELQALHLLR